jgi:hypothetical protein
MESRISFWPALGQLALFLLICLSTYAQPIKVEGYAIMSSDYVTQFDGKCFTLQKKDGIAVVDLTGKTLASGLKAPSTGILRNYKIPLYKGVLFADNGTAIVLKNVNGQMLGTGKYSDVKPFETWNTPVRVPSPQGAWIAAYLDTAGKEIVRIDVKKYLAITDPVSKLGAMTFITLDDFLPFSEGLTPIRSRVSGKSGYINKTLQLVIPVSFKAARPFSEGLAAVENTDGLWGFIDTKGKLVIPYTYTYSPGRFASGLAKVQSRDGKYGYANKDNKVVISPRFAYGTTFYKGYALAKVGYNDPPILIDTTGNVVATFPKNTFYVDYSKPGAGISGGEQFEYPFYVSETLRELVDEGKGVFLLGMLNYGLVDNKGNVVLDFKYKYLSDLHGGKMFGYIEKTSTAPYQIGILNDKGEWVVLFVASEF